MSGEQRGGRDGGGRGRPGGGRPPARRGGGGGRSGLPDGAGRPDRSEPLPTPDPDVHVIPGRNPVIEALRAGRRLREVVLDRRGGDDLDAIAQLAQRGGVRVSAADRDTMDALAEGVRHQGALALAPPFPYRALDEIGETDLVVVLDGVTDPQNLGSIARSAELAGAGALVLPKRRSAHVTPAAEKAAAGAFSRIAVALVPNVTRALADLADRGLWSVGLTGDADATVWSEPLLDGPVAIVVGAEGAGLSRLVSERVDARVAIPMAGALDSLNAGVAAGITLFEVRRRRLGSGA
jgi:23S rRNA (guanosine2251-2'-O)-methyltransferase